jgi:hypothetical protein
VRVLEAWQSIVNTLLVPLYSIVVLLYFVSFFFERIQKKKKRKRVPPSIPLAPPLEPGKVNMNGAFKLVKNENFDGFLAVQGVPWALRCAADQARPTHRFIHSGDTITIHIQGIIESQTTYEIGGPEKETSIRGRVFRDLISYLETGDGICSRKKSVTEDYDILVTRRLSPDRMSLTMTSRALFHDGSREPVESIQLFERIE